MTIRPEMLTGSMSPRHGPHGDIPGVLGLHRGEESRFITAVRRMGGRRSRRGMSLIEIMVVVMIMVSILGLGLGSLDQLLMAEQRDAARKIAFSYERLRDEAVMRNLTFRISYHIGKGEWEIQAAPPGVLIFEDSESREEAEEREESEQFFLTEEEKEAKIELTPNEQFKTVEGHWRNAYVLPENTRFDGVYTPQFEEMVMFDDEDEFEREDKPFVVHSHIFPNGFVEHTVVHVVDIEDPDEGFTIEVEPLSGKALLFNELVDWEDSFEFVPDEGPSLDN